MVLNATAAGGGDFGPPLRPVPARASRRSFAGVALLASAAVHAGALVAFGPFAAGGSRRTVVPAEPLVVQVAIAPARFSLPPPVPPADSQAARQSSAPPARPALPRADPDAVSAPRERVEGAAAVPPSPAPPASPAAIARAPAAGPHALAQAPVEALPPASVAVIPAAYLHTPDPAYPASSREEGEEGVVVLRVRISPRGLPEEIVVEDSSGFVALDRAALAGVKRWTFTPARRGVEAIEAWMRIPVRFRLG